MPEYPHLNKAPITEALLDLRVQLPPDVAVRDLEAFGAAVRGDFPDARPIQAGQAQFNMGTSPPTTAATVEEIGKIYWNGDTSRAVQARRDGFTVNWTRGYTNFDDLTAMAKPLWMQFCAVANPLRVTRCALRYINRIPLQVGKDLGEVVLTAPKLGEGIADGVAEYFMRVVVPFENDRRGVITQALLPTTTDGDAGLILDIDVFVEKELAPMDESIWNEFITLRELKNRCFFRSLTPAALEAFK